MKRFFREAGFAFLAWLLPFAGGVLLFPLKATNTPLFDTLMGVVLTVSIVGLGCIYLRRVREGLVVTGVRIGIVWMVANWMLDGLMFSGGPMKMSLGQYVADIGLAYLAIPAMTIGLGYAAANARTSSIRAEAS